MDRENYHPYSSEELEETMAAGGDLFREDEEGEKKKPALRLVKDTRAELKKEKEAQ
ncbi:hypothetical protein JW752_02180 [Candidatus Peregrinibacteria bacterium]|nr:hypothetical protein [Candidatus Peregrinibacteria bacterium]